MAIFHLTAKVVSRGKGQSVIAAAAYRSGQELTDEQTGEIKHYTARQERIQFEGIFAPPTAPDWAQDRQQLWNHVERFEKRKDAQLAREIEIALPHELTEEQREFLVKDFVREQFTRKGYAVDVAIHAPDHDADARNFHAHLLVTLRTLDQDGFAKLKDRSQNSTEQLQEWREKWAHLANKHLERHGHAERIDHRSNAARGIEAEPTIHLGYAAAQMQERGAQSDRVDMLRGILERNDGIRVASGGDRDLPSADPAPAAGAAQAPARTVFDTAGRPYDLTPETPHQKAARELREKQGEARAELKARQQIQREELRSELAQEMEIFRRQPRGAYSRRAEKATQEIGTRGGLKERRAAVFDKAQGARVASWDAARELHSATRRALREEHKDQWRQLDDEQLNQWRELQERREKELAVKRQAYDHAPAPRWGSMATMQDKVMRYLVERAKRKDRDAQRLNGGLADAAAHGLKNELAAQAQLGKQETAAAPDLPAPARSESPNKAEAVTVKRLQSGKAFTDAFREALARENTRETRSDEGNTKEGQKDRDGRSRSRGGDGRER